MDASTEAATPSSAPATETSATTEPQASQPPAAETAAAPVAQPETQQVQAPKKTVSQDPRFAKYFKMISMVRKLELLLIVKNYCNVLLDAVILFTLEVHICGLSMICFKKLYCTI